MVPQVITIQEAQTVKKVMEGIPLKFGVMMETAIFLARRAKKRLK
ncbi:MAG TPA: hypothetical protein VLH15_02820 [Dehalococcoidales bacterium]|nr:hypothetical protein [Dehalococcoidales bacterium]